VEDLAGAAPAGEQVDLVGDPRAGRVDQVDHRVRASRTARSMIRMIFSTVRAPQEPALTVESLAIRHTGGRRSGRSGDHAVGGQAVGQALASRPSSTKEPSSTSRAIRSRAKSLPLAVGEALVVDGGNELAQRVLRDGGGRRRRRRARRRQRDRRPARSGRPEPARSSAPTGGRKQAHRLEVAAAAALGKAADQARTAALEPERVVLLVGAARPHEATLQAHAAAVDHAIELAAGAGVAVEHLAAHLRPVLHQEQPAGEAALVRAPLPDAGHRARRTVATGSHHPRLLGHGRGRREQHHHQGRDSHESQDAFSPRRIQHGHYISIQVPTPVATARR
jgi:hypothetical protein